MAKNAATKQSQEPEQVDTTALVNRPCYRLYRQWTEVDGKKLAPGVYYHFSDRKTGDPRTLWVCNHLEVALSTHERETGDFANKLRFKTRAGTKELFIDQGMITGKGGILCQQLARKGLRINPSGGEEHVVKYLSEAAELSPLADSVRKPGWYDDSFVLPERTFGPDSVVMNHDTVTEKMFARAGTLEEWKEHVAKLCVGNLVPTLAISTAFGAMLLRLVGINGGGFHLKGDSSTGKTLSQQVAAGVVGNPAKHAYTASWKCTPNALELEAEIRNDLPLVLDEMKEANPHDVQAMVYMLANGQGKARMNDKRGLDPMKTWRVLVISSGEKNLTEHSALSGDPANAGAELRMVDINAGSRKYNAFDDIHDARDGATFWRKLNVGASNYYGTAGPAFLKRLTSDLDRDFVGELSKLLKFFPQYNSQAGRVADRFAVAALGGELAIEYGVLPWSPGSALDACQKLYQEWVQTQGRGNTEDRQILTMLSDFIDAHGDTRFSNISFGADRTPGPRAGYYELTGDNRVYHFNKAGLKAAVRGYGVSRVVQALDSVGALKRNRPDKNQNQIRVRNGGRPWFYTIDPERLTNAEAEG